MIHINSTTRTSSRIIHKTTINNRTRTIKNNSITIHIHKTTINNRTRTRIIIADSTTTYIHKTTINNRNRNRTRNINSTTIISCRIIHKTTTNNRNRTRNINSTPTINCRIILKTTINYSNIRTRINSTAIISSLTINKNNITENNTTVGNTEYPSSIFTTNSKTITMNSHRTTNRNTILKISISSQIKSIMIIQIYIRIRVVVNQFIQISK